ncbi:Fumarate reductase flavoprotein subunit precursor [Variovorax sp. PBS-H4]|uniref:FAD-dependent tricarballylate dehydrogenase TcuA n=1 Tax=Variovorax sp. PBS-H4 TaxID=434008 RepID=UPI0013193E59|nr:FAD-dependent tricarballylate dehydrogenase TcuA [Variovorax sp. PBS-H4]VTU34448.1 Fumarate reductase flavoprotein subunit precursor [Variovorax sp. PBS-H4]
MSENNQVPEHCDVLVIGCGVSGLSAAVAAGAAGASVIVLERATPDEFGGNTRWTESYFRMKDEDSVSDDFEELLVANAGHHLDPNIIQHAASAYEDWPPYVKAHGMPDPELISTLAAGAGPTVQWLKTFGVRFAALPTYFVTAAAPRLMPVGGGLALIEALRDEAVRTGVEIRYETTAQALLRDDGQGQVVVDTYGSDGRLRRIQALSVVLATGGFEGNPEMLTRYIGPEARYLRPVARGGYYNKGEGIRMALDAGAAPAGDFGSYHAEPMDPRSAQVEPLVMSFSYGILVNREGRRFVDEAPGPIDVHYDHISRAIKNQPDGIAYMVYDQRIHDVPNWKKGIRTDQPPLQAGTLRELAVACGISESGLQGTVDAFNAACGQGEFSPLKVDGLGTTGIEPRKSNWARPIEQGPFCAYPVMSGVCFTYGGVKTNRLAQVIDNDGRPIRGLYAAGEAAGLYYQVYTGATSVLRGAVFGKIAGEHAALRAMPP